MLPQCYPNYKTVHRRFQCTERPAHGWCSQIRPASDS
jgi:hypothetical protein